MQPQRTVLTDFSDKELIQLLVVSLVEVEKRAARLESFISDKFGKSFDDFQPPQKDDIRKAIIGYHDDALSDMESN